MQMRVQITEEIMRELRLPVDLIKEVQTLVARHMDFKGYAPGIPKDKKLRKLQYLLGEKQYWRLLDLIEADNLSHAPGYCIEGQIEEIRKRTREMNTMFNYSLPVSGADIMKVRKIGPSKLVKGYLEYLLKLAFVNPDLSREDMLKRLKNLSPKYLGKEYVVEN